MNNRNLSLGLMFIFALPSVMQGFMHTPANVVLAGVYATDFGLNLAAISTGLVIAKMFDAITDPLLGVLSDKLHAKYKTRKPLMLLGSVITAVSVWFLFNPGPDVTVFWFTFWFMGTYLGWTITEIPYRAWSVELTSDYAQRSMIQTLLAVGMLGGGALFFVIPFLAKKLGVVETTNVDSTTLGYAAMLVLVAMPLFNLLAIWKVPNGEIHAEKKKDSARQIFQSLIGNFPFLYIILAYIVIGIGGGMNQAIGFFYIGSYLGIPEHYATILLMALPWSLVGAVFWGWACVKLQKHRAWSLGLATMVLPNFYVLTMVEPGLDALVPMMVCISITLFGFASALVAVPSMLGDVADYGLLKFGHDRSGTYISFYTFAFKLVNALGGIIAIWVVGYWGFDAQVAVQSSDAIFGLELAYLIIPSVLGALMIPVIWFYPFGRARHSEVLKQLAEKDKALLAKS